MPPEYWTQEQFAEMSWHDNYVHALRIVQGGHGAGVPNPPIATAGCREASGKLAPFVDRSRCEGKADCVRVCPYGVFEIRKLAPEDRSLLSTLGKLKAWIHGWKQSHVVNPGACHACRLCIDVCPENALELRPLT